MSSSLSSVSTTLSSPPSSSLDELENGKYDISLTTNIPDIRILNTKIELNPNTEDLIENVSEKNDVAEHSTTITSTATTTITTTTVSGDNGTNTSSKPLIQTQSEIINSVSSYLPPSSSSSPFPKTIFLQLTDLPAATSSSALTTVSANNNTTSSFSIVPSISNVSTIITSNNKPVIKFELASGKWYSATNT